MKISLKTLLQIRMQQYAGSISENAFAVHLLPQLLQNKYLMLCAVQPANVLVTSSGELKLGDLGEYSRSFQLELYKRRNMASPLHTES